MSQRFPLYYYYPLKTSMIPMIYTLNEVLTIAASFGNESGFEFSPLWWALASGADFLSNKILKNPCGRFRIHEVYGNC